MEQVFTKAYIEALYFTDASCIEDECSHDNSLSPETLAEINQECAKFYNEHRDIIEEGLGATQAGHDFWLTRNGHGAGFWDGDWPEDAGDRLTEASRDFGPVDVYLGDDGLIYTT